MGYWEIIEDRDDYGRGGFGMREDEVEKAYREGCRKGYEKAKREMMGQRGDGYGYGELRMTPYYPEYPMDRREEDYEHDDMGERRRRRSNGRWY